MLPVLNQVAVFAVFSRSHLCPTHQCTRDNFSHVGHTVTVSRILSRNMKARSSFSHSLLFFPSAICVHNIGSCDVRVCRGFLRLLHHGTRISCVRNICSRDVRVCGGFPCFCLQSAGATSVPVTATLAASSPVFVTVRSASVLRPRSNSPGIQKK